jgi:hypothetical protein
MQDATGDRRYWPISTTRDQIDIEGLRRDRDQILAEALHRLASGELHWPTPEEEERLIVPERQKFRPEVALEIIAILERFIIEEPLTTRPNRVDFAWKWQRRPQPLQELHLDEFFEKCFGMYAAVRRQGLDRASRKDISYCTTRLRENGWRRVTKQLPDGQRVVVWRALAPSNPGQFTSTQASELGLRWTEETSQAGTRAAVTCSLTDVADVVDVADVGGRVPNVDPSRPNVDPENRPITISNQLLNITSTQNNFSRGLAQSENFEGGYNFYFEEVRGKSCLGLRDLNGLTPTTLDDLEELFPRDRFLALDVETTGLLAASDGLRTVQIFGRRTGCHSRLRPPRPGARVGCTDRFPPWPSRRRPQCPFRGELVAAGGYRSGSRR